MTQIWAVIATFNLYVSSPLHRPGCLRGPILDHPPVHVQPYQPLNANPEARPFVAPAPKSKKQYPPKSKKQTTVPRHSKSHKQPRFRHHQ